MRVAMTQPPRSGLSPLSDDTFKLSRRSTAETLVELDADGAPQASLATKWQQSGRARAFEIRDGVTFHDGTTLDAETVVRSPTRAATASPEPRVLDGVELTVRAADADTVTVTTADEDPLVPQRLSSPQLPVLAAKAYTGRTVNPVGAGTGPFEPTEVNDTSSASPDRYDDSRGTKAEAPSSGTGHPASTYGSCPAAPPAPPPCARVLRRHASAGRHRHGMRQRAGRPGGRRTDHRADANRRERVLELLAEQQEAVGAALVPVTHDMDAARRHAHRTLVQDGRITSRRPPR